MADIYIPWRIRDLNIPNRIVRSATWEGMAKDDGEPTYDTSVLTSDLAKGGVGLIVTGFAYVDIRGKALMGQTGVYANSLIGPLTRISDAVHKNGGLVALQLVHAGGQTKSEWINNLKPVGPSFMINPTFKEEVEELSQGHIEDIIEKFALSASRAKAAGFDAVQLHAGHGYLLSQFLSPFTNRRNDQYGIDAEGRSRFIWEVCSEIRNVVGSEFPVFIKINSEDAVEGGLTLEDSLVCIRRLVQNGIDAIEVTGGVPYAGKLSPARFVKKTEDEGYFLENAKIVKKNVECPVIVVGGWRSKIRIEFALDFIDAVAMSRPLIRQSNLVDLWRNGKENTSQCISCGGCFITAREGNLSCKKLKDKSY